MFDGIVQVTHKEVERILLQGGLAITYIHLIFPLSQRCLLISQLLFINACMWRMHVYTASLSFFDLSAVNGESCDAALGPSSTTTGDVLPPADEHEDCTQDATVPDSDTAPNSTSQPLPTSTQAPASSSSSDAAKPTDGGAAAAASSTLTSPAQGATVVTTSSSSSSPSPALGEANASGGAGGNSSNSATADGAKPRQQAPNAGAADPLPPG